jgi:hypothetical protein
LPGTGHRVACEHEATLLQHLERSGPRVRVSVAVWQHGDHGEDVLARARLALEATPAMS